MDNRPRKNNFGDMGRNFHHNYEEEYGTEITPDETEVGDATSGGVIAGVIGILSSIIALFVMPLTLGIIGIILGGIATMRDARNLGITSIIIGIVAVCASLFYRVALISLFFRLM